MSVLSMYFDSSVNQCSPCQVDVYRKVNIDSDGNEFITYPEVDYPALTASLGSADDWSLKNLLKAGINPDFPIRTGLNTRLEGVDTIQQAEAYFNQVFEDAAAASEASEPSEK